MSSNDIEKNILRHILTHACKIWQNFELIQYILKIYEIDNMVLKNNNLTLTYSESGALIKSHC